MGKFIFVALGLLQVDILHADWSVRIDKNASVITGVRNAHVATRSKGTYLVMGCADAKPYLRIAESFKFSNKLNAAFTRSAIERALDKSEKFGFLVQVRDGHPFARVKLRLSRATEYLDAETNVGYRDGTYVLFLDDRLPSLLDGMKTDPKMFVQLQYKDSGDKIREFSLEGLEEALAKIEAVGCKIGQP